MSKGTSSNDMQQDTTEIGIPIKQQQALDLLLQGQSITAVSQQINVDRSTLYRWQGTADFEAERNRQLCEIRDAAQARLARMAEKSFSVIEEAIDRGDEKTALAVLKGIGFLNGVPAQIGSSDPERIQQDRVASEKKQALNDLMTQLKG